jgi:hypothetical protein
VTHARGARRYNHRHVAPGRIRLVVEVPFKPTGHGVYIAVSRSRKSVTPGRYCWQASYDSDSPLGIYWSGIGSFVVK